jgi:hypothetical protein
VSDCTLLGDEGLIEVGDEIRGNWGAYGEGERVFVQRLGRNVDTYFQGRYGSVSAAIQKAKEWSGDQ